MDTTFLQLKVYGDFIFSNAQGQETTQWVIGSGRISKSSEIPCMFLLPASIKSIKRKATEKMWQRHFPILTLWELSVAMEEGLDWVKCLVNNGLIFNE